MADTPIDSGAMTDDLDDALLTRYLTGSCTEEEQVRVEDELLAEGPVYERLRALEEELIDRHLRGELRGEARARFESAYSSSPRRDRVLFAQSMKQMLAPEAKPSFWDSIRAAFTFRLAFAAAALLLLAAVVLLRSERAAPSAPVVARVEEPQKRVEESKPPEPSPSPPLVATFVLSPGLVRSGGGPAGFMLAPTIKEVRVQLELEPGVEYASYRVELRDRRANVIWSQDGRRATEGTVVVTFPSSVLETSDYEMVLLGAVGGGRPEDVGHYYFEVIKR